MKQTVKYTKKAARETIEAYRDNTAYFTGEVAQCDMFDMLKYRMGFGDAETRVIIAALVLAGAKFGPEHDPRLDEC